MGSMPALVAVPVDQAFGLLDRQVLAAPAASITFSGIAAANTMLRLTLYNIQDGVAGNVDVRLNNDGGANYDHQDLTGDAAAVNSARAAAAAQIRLTTGETVDNGEHSTHEVLIAKQLATEEAMIVAASTYIHTTTPAINFEQTAAIWNNTGALVSRVDAINSSNFAAGTVAVLEGNQTT